MGGWGWGEGRVGWGVGVEVEALRYVNIVQTKHVVSINHLMKTFVLIISNIRITKRCMIMTIRFANSGFLRRPLLITLQCHLVESAYLKGI